MQSFFSSHQKVVIVDDDSQLFKRLLLALTHCNTVVVISQRHRPYFFRHFQLEWRRYERCEDCFTADTLLYLLKNMTLNYRVARSLEKARGTPAIVSLMKIASLRSNVVVVDLPFVWGSTPNPQRVRDLLNGLVVLYDRERTIHISNALIALVRLGRHLLRRPLTKPLYLRLHDTLSPRDDILLDAVRQLKLEYVLSWQEQQGQQQARQEQHMFHDITCDFVNYDRSRSQALESMRRHIVRHFARESALPRTDISTIHSLLHMVESTVKFLCLSNCRDLLTKFVVRLLS
jgi:hypothetical protein